MVDVEASVAVNCVIVRVYVEFGAKDAVRSVKRGDLIIVVDVLRCSSSIVSALANGVKAVIPTETLKEAYGLREQHPSFLLVGERRGRKLRGFDLGNSPLEFVREVVGGRTVIMTTTSGTRALVRCRRAEHVLVGAFLNAEAVAEKALEIAQRRGVNVSFVLAGEKGLFSLEDFLCAGAIASEFPADGFDFSDEALTSVLGFERVKNTLSEYVGKSRHAKHLIELGFERDIEFSCMLNHFGLAPVYRDGKVTLMR
jgi:2-phosphosulfolactate phosphatase